MTADRGRAFISGTTTLAHPESPVTPVFAVEGASHTGYLRTGVGDIYADGQWLAEKQTGITYRSFSDIVPDASIHPTVEAVENHRQDITVSGLDSTQLVPAGIVPTSKRLEQVGIDGMFWQPSAMFAIYSPRSSYYWSSIVDEYSDAQLNAAGRTTGLVNSPYTSLPEWARSGRIRDLAIEIISGHSTPYSQAKAIEQYLRTEYAYRPPETSRDGAPPAGRDPVDWFLFDKREGASGSFSSAFVFLARAVGLPARVVSGWEIDTTPGRQTVYSDQAHQWVEVALEGVGWIDFDPTRETGLADLLEALAEGDPGAIADALEALADEGSEAVADALGACEGAGLGVDRLENGCGLVRKVGKQYFVPGNGALQASEPPDTPLFKVTGAANTGYLRTSVGDLYESGGWRQLDPVSVDAFPNISISVATWAQYGRPDTEFGQLPQPRRSDASLFGFRQNEHTVQIDNIRMSPIEPTGNLPIGRMPTSLDLQSVERQGVYYPFSSTFYLDEEVSTFSWASRIVSFQAQDLEGAGAVDDPTYLQLPPDLPPRIQELAEQITSGYTSPYAKAKALETYLKTEYPYRFAGSPDDLPPPGRDPVDWFLFDHREGTCGVFSSAFVVMARSVGIPARVVSGWAISQTDGTQTVRADQAHQWAEIALKGLGWITFEPTAPGGAPSRAGGAGEGTGGAQGGLDSGELEDVQEALEEGDSEAISDALGALEEAGVEVVRLENGGAIIGGRFFFVGTTTAQANRSMLPIFPVYVVTGAEATPYLRTTVGDVYTGNGWRQLDPVRIDERIGESVPEALQREYSDPNGAFSAQPPERRSDPSLFGIGQRPSQSSQLLIHVQSAEPDILIPTGSLPVSPGLQDFRDRDVYYPYSGTLRSPHQKTDYRYLARVQHFTLDQLRRADIATDPTYLQLIPDLPDRVRQLAEQVTQGHLSPYEKAQALAIYLTTNYTYRFADGPEDAPPPGHDAVDWFLFEHREGTCGVFSSAFAVMARAVGVPARVVSGWAIDSTPEVQTVYTNQAHQWAEIALEGIGWVAVEPTPAGAPLRAYDRRAKEDVLDPLVISGGDVNSKTTIVQPVRTFTSIIQSPTEVRGGQPFIVSGTVHTAAGHAVDGMRVEIFANKTKERGGRLIGTAVTGSGRWSTVVRMHLDMEAGTYQLLARAVEKDQYNESWSEPGIEIKLRQDTVTTITEWPTEARWDEPLTVAGTVETVGGHPVSDMWVEVYANKTNEHGGRLIGIAVPRSGHWSAEVRMPRDMETGTYQLFARAVENSRYNESWSDPGKETKLGQDTVTTITRSPTEAQRERALTVAGTVETVSGSLVSDMRVEVYVNETKEHGGRLIGTTVTRSGSWSAEVRIPRDMELGAYQLLARAVENDHFYESWSDPDITVYSGSGLELTGPTRVPVDDEAAFEGRLSDDGGMGLENREMVVSVDGVVTDSIMTSPQGTFAFTLTFSEPGQHWVNVEVAETDFVLGNSVRLGVYATLPTKINLEAPVSVETGEEFHVTGTLLSVRGEPLAGRPVVVSIGENLERHRFTDDDGAFEIQGSLDTPGVYTVRTEFEREGWVLASTATARLLVRERALLTLDGPSTIELGSGGTFTGLLATAEGAPIPQSTLSIVDDNDAELVTVTTGDDGRFEYQHSSFLQTGPQSLTARYPGADLIVPSSARIAFSVLAKTSMSLELPTIVRDTDSFTLQGGLKDINGDPVPDVEVEVTGRDAQTLLTDADGRFSWETVATFDESVAESAHESHLAVEVFFSGTDHLAPAAAAAEVAVGVPRILLEPLEPVTRGDAVTLRGTVLLGNGPMPGVDLDVAEQGSVQSGTAGEFSYRYQVADDLPLGTSDVTVTAPALDVSASAPLNVRSAVSIVVTPVEEVRPGEMTLLQATLQDDRRAPISEAALRSDDGVNVVTDDLGVALLELTVPDEEDALAFFVTITFDGDNQHMPLTYFVGVPLSPPAGLNWFLWVGAASAVVALVAAVYAGRKVRRVPLPALVRRRRVTASPAAESASTLDTEALTKEEPTDTGAQVTLEVAFNKAADLPDVWGLGEDVIITVTALDNEGHALVDAEIVVTVAGEEPVTLVSGDDGACTLHWTSSEPGEHTVSATFAGDEDHLPAAGLRDFRVVDFRVEIVRLYNSFLDWIRASTGNPLDRETPREVELMLVSSSLPVSQKSLDEVISRFEEADYSEHPIARRHYEAMYRAWRAVVEE